MRKLCAAVLALSLVLAPARSSAQFINFEIGSAPCVFVDASPLTTYYQALGVTFGGNGAILDECSEFGVNALSGSNFWAFNSQAPGWGSIAEINFTVPAYSFSIWAATGWEAGLFAAAAFDPSGALVASNAVVTQVGEWRRIALNYGPGMSQLFITATDPHFVLDDMEFSPVPEPSTFLLLGTGLLGVAGVVIYRRKDDDE